MPAPVIIQIRRGKSIAFACCLGFATAIFAGVFMLELSGNTTSAWIVSLMFIAMLVSLAGTVFLIGISMKNPVALRMDATGISGFYADVATWGEIAEIGTYTGHKGHRFLGFALVDPVAFRDRQTAFRRFTSWSNGHSHGYHIMVPELILDGTTVSALLEQAEQFHAIARSSPGSARSI